MFFELLFDQDFVLQTVQNCLISDENIYYIRLFNLISKHTKMRYFAKRRIARGQPLRSS
jgi:hypothetical protein